MARILNTTYEHVVGNKTKMATEFRFDTVDLIVTVIALLLFSAWSLNRLTYLGRWELQTSVSLNLFAVMASHCWLTFVSFYRPSRTDESFRTIPDLGITKHHAPTLPAWVYIINLDTWRSGRRTAVSRCAHLSESITPMGVRLDSTPTHVVFGFSTKERYHSLFDIKMSLSLISGSCTLFV